MHSREEKKTKINGSCHVFLENVHRIGIRDNGAISGLMAVIIITLQRVQQQHSQFQPNKEILDYVFFSAEALPPQKYVCTLLSIPERFYMMVNLRKKWRKNKKKV